MLMTVELLFVHVNLAHFTRSQASTRYGRLLTAS
jgi:hypothetical protein